MTVRVLERFVRWIALQTYVRITIANAVAFLCGLYTVACDGGMSITGRVTAGGMPVHGARILLAREGYPDEQLATSDRRGCFAYHGIASASGNRRTLKINAPDYDGVIITIPNNESTAVLVRLSATISSGSSNARLLDEASLSELGECKGR